MPSSPLFGSGPSRDEPPLQLKLPPATFDLTHLTVHELLKLRNEVERRLPARDLGDLNLNRELVLQMLATQDLQTQVLADQATPANQKAQVVNSLAAILTQLSKLQSSVFTTERLKRIEKGLLQALKGLPDDRIRVFLVEYEQILEDTGHGTLEG